MSIEPILPPPSIVLAPMEGVIDAPMRQMLSTIGGYDRCVTEFIRVSDVLLPERVFFRLCPELLSGGRTRAGVPVYTQLLGSHCKAMAANARRAVVLGSLGIDLNFGCPAKTVNNSMGGSILLRTPQRVTDLVAAVRNAVPESVPVTVKIRIGYDNAEQLAEIVAGIRGAGATELAIHARTKFDGYKPPAYWSTVRPVVAIGDTSTVINGEIWSEADSLAARVASGCQQIMLGRGALAAPDLARRIKSGCGEPMMPWQQLVDLVERQFIGSDSQSTRHVGNRTKQWLAYLKRHYPEAQMLFARLRTLHDVAAIQQAFAQHRLLDLLPPEAIISQQLMSG